MDLVGSPAAGVKYIHVLDRGADNLEVFCHCALQQSDWVIRAAQLQRTVYTTSGERLSLAAALAKQRVLGSYEQKVRATKDQPARTARMEVRAVCVTIRRPKRLTKFLRQIEFQELTQWAVETREVDPPSGVEPLHWVLWTSLPVPDLAAARLVIEYYSARWTVEEFHKAVKTGCRLEERQYMTAARLEAVAGITCVLAIRLVQLKTVAQATPELPARHIVPLVWLQMLQVLRKRRIETVRDFFRHLAGLGGFLMRKRDGEPGWITIWRGLEKLLIGVRCHLAMPRCG